jgi:phenol 2-monooxygenase
MTEYEGTEDLVNGIEQPSQGLSPEHLERLRKQRTTITPEQILEKGRDFMCQYRFQKKKGTEIFWWAVYGVGQRLSDRFIVDDTLGHPRVFLVGDGRSPSTLTLQRPLI